MSQTNISIRMDSDVKKDFSDFCSEAGMSMTTAFNIFAKKVVRQQRIPFDIGVDYVKDETREAIEEVRRMKENPHLIKAYNNVDEIMKDVFG